METKRTAHTITLATTMFSNPPVVLMVDDSTVQTADSEATAADSKTELGWYVTFKQQLS